MVWDGRCNESEGAVNKEPANGYCIDSVHNNSCCLLFVNNLVMVNYFYQFGTLEEQ